MTTATASGAPARAYLALGSNLGDREAHLRAGIDGIDADPKTTVVRVSRLYQTPPWGPIPQGPYLNACTEIETTLTPRALLELCLAVERSRGRERTVRWGPRTLDIDVLTYGNMVVDEPDLKIPHPRMMERAFVLVPLAEIASKLSVGGTAIADVLSRLDARDIVEWQG